MRNLVQVIVVVLILLVTAGMALSGIAKVREAASRVTCENNLKQLALGLSNYQNSSKDLFPAGTIHNEYLPPEKRLSWIIEILPFMECSGPLLLDREKAWDSEENRQPMEGSKDPSEEKHRSPVGQLRFLICPANPNRTDPTLPGVTHYVGIAGLGFDAAMLTTDDPRAGVFGYDRRMNIEDIKDRSSTLLLMETATANGPWTAGGPATVRGIDPEGPPYLGRDGQFSSRHSVSFPAVNVALVDGSVRAITPNVSRRVLEALATVTDRDNVGLDW